MGWGRGNYDARSPSAAGRRWHHRCYQCFPFSPVAAAVKIAPTCSSHSLSPRPPPLSPSERTREVADRVGLSGT